MMSEPRIDFIGSAGAFKGVAVVANSLPLRGAIWQRIEPVLEKTLAISIFLVLWEIVPRIGLIDRSYVPPLSEVLIRGFQFLLAGKLLPHIVISIQRALGGYLLGVVFGVPLGLLIGWNKTLERYLDPFLQLLRQTSPMALFPVFIILFGVGYATQIIIILWVVFWPILLNTISGVKYVNPLLVKSARSMGVTSLGLFTKVVLPSCIPSIVTGLRLSASYSLLMLVAAEMVGAYSGLGYLIVNAQYLFTVHLLYVGVIILALFGVLTNWGLVRLERRLTTWKEEIHA
ncbi:MAG: ABC transporter permease [Thermacetogeniaceae bacterium]